MTQKAWPKSMTQNVWHKKHDTKSMIQKVGHKKYDTKSMTQIVWHKKYDTKNISKKALPKVKSWLSEILSILKYLYWQMRVYMYSKHGRYWQTAYQKFLVA